MYEVHYTRPNGTVASLQPVPMLIMLACVVAAWVYLSHMVSGRENYAVGGNEEAARFSGLRGGADQAAGVCAVGAGRGDRGDGLVRVLRIGGDEHRRRL